MLVSAQAVELSPALRGIGFGTDAVGDGLGAAGDAFSGIDDGGAGVDDVPTIDLSPDDIELTSATDMDDGTDGSSGFSHELGEDNTVGTTVGTDSSPAESGANFDHETNDNNGVGNEPVEPDAETDTGTPDEPADVDIDTENDAANAESKPEVVGTTDPLEPYEENGTYPNIVEGQPLLDTESASNALAAYMGDEMGVTPEQIVKLNESGEFHGLAVKLLEDNGYTADQDTTLPEGKPLDITEDLQEMVTEALEELEEQEANENADADADTPEAEADNDQETPDEDNEDIDADTEDVPTTESLGEWERDGMYYQDVDPDYDEGERLFDSGTTWRLVEEELIKQGYTAEEIRELTKDGTVSGLVNNLLEHNNLTAEEAAKTLKLGDKLNLPEDWNENIGNIREDIDAESPADADAQAEDDSAEPEEEDTAKPDAEETEDDDDSAPEDADEADNEDTESDRTDPTGDTAGGNPNAPNATDPAGETPDASPETNPLFDDSVFDTWAQNLGPEELRTLIAAPPTAEPPPILDFEDLASRIPGGLQDAIAAHSLDASQKAFLDGLLTNMLEDEDVVAALEEHGYRIENIRNKDPHTLASILREIGLSIGISPS